MYLGNVLKSLEQSVKINFKDLSLKIKKEACNLQAM